MSRINAICVYCASGPGTSPAFVTAARNFGGVHACYRYNGTAWVPLLGPGIDHEVHAVAPLGNDMVVGGLFQTISGVSLNGIARWDGSTFHPLGSGMTSPPFSGSVEVLSTLDNGDLIAGGEFTAAGGTSANNIARWNGSAWSALGSGLDWQVLAMAFSPDGNGLRPALIAGASWSLTLRLEIRSPKTCTSIRSGT